jgi:hypothetical protein
MTKVDRVDIMCREHNVALTVPAHEVALLIPNDPTDGSQGWSIDLDSLCCPEDIDRGDCCDSWEVLTIE